ncbi:hypothetical protein EG329_010965 [Mollisiaceae sp. DMI_Dod_QoI]|nr:hypothetical protein EG329_010965 [Helotiales sp. DMI_Dod_QoI]
MQEGRHGKDFPELSQSSYPEMGFEGDAEVGKYLSGALASLAKVNQDPSKTFDVAIALDRSVLENHESEYTFSCPIVGLKTRHYTRANVFNPIVSTENLHPSNWSSLSPASNSVFRDGGLFWAQNGYPSDQPMDADQPWIHNSTWTEGSHQQFNTSDGVNAALASSYPAPATSISNQFSELYDHAKTANTWYDENLEVARLFNHVYPAIASVQNSMLGQYQFPTQVNNMLAMSTTGFNSQVAAAAPGGAVASNATVAAPTAPTSTLAHIHRCTFGSCNKSFKRNSCRHRHEQQTHRNAQAIYTCMVAGCSARYKRADKLTEHMWKKHADLGHRKAW